MAKKHIARWHQAAAAGVDIEDGWIQGGSGGVELKLSCESGGILVRI